ncbi:MAG: ABC transporter ATP-binding protein [Clostridia bacterium]|nr:ABC transporter ATP-binding protein [Clostridia bacterium]
MKEFLSAKNVSKAYKQGDRTVFALKDVSLTIEEGLFHAVTGPSGCGKTTLLNILGALDVPTHGDVLYDGVPIYEKMSEKERSALRLNRIGFVFQHYGLVSFMTTYENIVTPCVAAKRKIDRDYLAELVRVLKIKDRLDHIPAELSGGERQRVAIARALILKPGLVLADEPTGNLDKDTSEEVLSFLLALKKTYSLTLVMVTHDASVAELADRHIRMDDGRIII